jgi:hypothetical protein
MPPRQPPTNRRTKEGIFAESVQKFPSRLVLMSEGDSWFSYPLNRNLADYIEMMSDFSMLRMEWSGDEAREILATGSSQYRKLRDFLRRYPFELILFSAGGNDVIGSDLKGLMTRNVPAGSPWTAYLDRGKLDARIDEVIDAYRRLIKVRDELRPGCKIVTHTYDYVVPDGRKAPGLLGLVRVGPWIKKYLDPAGLTDPAGAREFAKALIDAFAARMLALEAESSDFHVVDTRGTLPADHTHWNDEIHPTGTGFGKLAERWRGRLQTLFPGRGF